MSLPSCSTPQIQPPPISELCIRSWTAGTTLVPHQASLWVSNPCTPQSHVSSPCSRLSFPSHSAAFADTAAETRAHGPGLSPCPPPPPRAASVGALPSRRSVPEKAKECADFICLLFYGSRRLRSPRGLRSLLESRVCPELVARSVRERDVHGKGVGGKMPRSYRALSARLAATHTSPASIPPCAGCVSVPSTYARIDIPHAIRCGCMFGGPRACIFARTAYIHAH